MSRKRDLESSARWRGKIPSSSLVGWGSHDFDDMVESSEARSAVQEGAFQSALFCVRGLDTASLVSQTARQMLTSNHPVASAIIPPDRVSLLLNTDRANNRGDVNFVSVRHNRCASN